MPRGHLSKRLPAEDAIRLFAEHHIVQVRQRKNGEITQVKHAALGWMTADQYYMLQKLHDPLVVEAAKMGWAFNIAVYTFMPSAEVAGFGVSIPVGPALLLAAIVDLIEALASKDPQRTLKAFVKIFMPFGVILQIAESVQGAVSLAVSPWVLPPWLAPWLTAAPGLERQIQV